ncbi:hypothetical protein [Leptospira bouyouniensis]|uniref:hypothetical protein n=1 Tax=Leptospira bouyouniensis TaxID=2484911 RepID=UPI0010916B08|nr:hypothetical protein [Leptospira bouyouniensis]TGM80406.1 hypothetical protein EHQ99_12055 [Leptospira bouyouniensis]
MIRKITTFCLVLVFGFGYEIHSARLFTFPSTNNDCRFKPGYYIESIPLEDGELKIHVEITNEFATFHRIIDKYYVKNEINWTKDCEFELVTLEITDPILLDSDFIGNKTYYRVKQVKETTFQYMEVNKQNVISLQFQGLVFPHAVME